MLRRWRGRGNASGNWARVAGGSTLLNFLPPGQQGKPSSGDLLSFLRDPSGTWSCTGTRGLLQHSDLACLIHQAHPAGCSICLYLSLGGDRIAGVRLRRLGYGGLRPSAAPGGLRFVCKSWKERDFFVWLSIVTSPVLAPVLAWGSECQPCSHTSCGTAKAARTLPRFAPYSERPRSILNILSREKG